MHGDPIGGIPRDLLYVLLLFALFVIPKALQRYRIPAAITALLLGILTNLPGLFSGDATVYLLSTFGIVALFLFAGLEINGGELRRDIVPLVQYAVLWSVLVAGTAVAAKDVFSLNGRAALLTSLALMTPSTGFILSSLGTFGLRQREQHTVKTVAISAELLALGALFFVLQSTSMQRLGLATAGMLGLIVIIPLAFRAFAKVVAPFAPRSEFAFLLMVAVACAYATRRLGVYYLVGAFIVGVAAQRFRARMPAMSSEKMVDALEAFGSVFIPFYFFNAGLYVNAAELTLLAVAVGLALVVVFVPLRVTALALHRRLVLREETSGGRRVGIAMVPTLVFTLVLSDILRAYDAPQWLVGALIVYTVVNTLIPAFALHTAPAEFEHVEASAVQPLQPEEVTIDSGPEADARQA